MSGGFCLFQGLIIVEGILVERNIYTSLFQSGPFCEFGYLIIVGDIHLNLRGPCAKIVRIAEGLGNTGCSKRWNGTRSVNGSRNMMRV